MKSPIYTTTTKLKTLQVEMDSLAKKKSDLMEEVRETSAKLGLLLRMHRVERRMRQKTAASRLGMHQAKLCQIENGEASASVSDAEKICKLMGGGC